MARIRSIHPGFWTDEDIVSVSRDARILLIGLGSEADDKGTFPWKPTTIKMRIFPADCVDVVPLLDELAGADLVRRYGVDGKAFGAIRNFRKHQRPKTPNDIHPITEELRNYVGLAASVSEKAEAKQGQISEIDELKQPQFPKSDELKGGAFPRKGEIATQMEDGGCRGGGNKKKEEPIGSSKKETRKRASRLPDDWVLDDVGRQYAIGKGLTHSQAETEAEKFRNYWHSKGGQGATKLDWPATWRNWVLNAIDRLPRGNSQKPTKQFDRAGQGDFTDPRNRSLLAALHTQFSKLGDNEGLKDVSEFEREENHTGSVRGDVQFIPPSEEHRLQNADRSGFGGNGDLRIRGRR